MRSLRTRLPPLAALIAFEAAARHLSFTKAARDIHVTQAAVSRHVHNLESYLGVPLFHRGSRTLELTAEGKRLQSAVTMGLEHIAVTSEAIRTTQKADQVTVATTAAFATF